jgi:hypothetical protein
MPCASNVIQRPGHGSGLRSNLSARATTTTSVAALAQLTTPMPGAPWRMPADGSTHIRTGESSRPSECSLCSRCKRSEFLLVTRAVRRHRGLRPGMVHSRRTGDRDANRGMSQRPIRRCLGDIPPGDREATRQGARRYLANSPRHITRTNESAPGRGAISPQDRRSGRTLRRFFCSVLAAPGDEIGWYKERA